MEKANCWLCVSHSVVSDSSRPHGLGARRPPGSSVHEILQARILEWVVIPFSRGSSWPRDRTQVSCIAGRLLPSEPPWKPYTLELEKKVFVTSVATDLLPGAVLIIFLVKFLYVDFRYAVKSLCDKLFDNPQSFCSTHLPSTWAMRKSNGVLPALSLLSPQFP